MLFSFSSQWPVNLNWQKVNSSQLPCLSGNWILLRMAIPNVVLSAPAWVYNCLEATAGPDGARYKSSFYGPINAWLGCYFTVNNSFIVKPHQGPFKHARFWCGAGGVLRSELHANPQRPDRSPNLCELRWTPSIVLLSLRQCVHTLRCWWLFIQWQSLAGLIWVPCGASGDVKSRNFTLEQMYMRQDHKPFIQEYPNTPEMSLCTLWKCTSARCLSLCHIEACRYTYEAKPVEASTQSAWCLQTSAHFWNQRTIYTILWPAIKSSSFHQSQWDLARSQFTWYTGIPVSWYPLCIDV